MFDKTAVLARDITKSSSKQTYYTARIMVDKNLELDCFRAYGYFRWVDDIVDIKSKTLEERQDFIHRQKDLVERLYRGERPNDLIPEEEILADLIHNDIDKCYRLRSYIHNFLAIIEFDVERKGRMITKNELDWYANTLGKAVTDGILYFVCNDFVYPESEHRYLAATGAHITHMLRDLVEDFRAGYFNIPKGVFTQDNPEKSSLTSEQMRIWVKSRVVLAQQYFDDGKRYLDKLPVLRCRIVGYWYCARFERLLNIIEGDDYILRESYEKGNRFVTWLKFAYIAMEQTWRHAIYHIQNGSGICSVSQSRMERTYD
jgi:phytoene/squalene synthetase